MYGLKSLSTEHTEVLVLLKTLVMQMARCTQPLDGQELSNALFGDLHMCLFDIDMFLIRDMKLFRISEF